MLSSSEQATSSVLIVGSGVFGLGTAHALATRDEFRHTKITVLERVDFPAPDGSSIDSSRIIRPDYADGAYTSFMAEAHKYWRGDFGADGRYTEAGLCIVTDEGDGAGKGEASDYMLKAMENVKSRLGLKVGRREDRGQVEPLVSAADISRVMATMEGDCGTKGYVNWTSGWADAEAGVRHMRKLVERTERVDFKTSEVRRLEFGDGKIESVELTSGEHLKADLVVLATGAWTPKLVDLRGVCSASGHVLAYLDLSEDEQDRLGRNPTLLCENSGMFIIQPRGRQLKVARHGYGYANPTVIPHPERPDSGETITVSLPRTKMDDENLNIPPEGDRACRAFLKKSIPYLADRPWTHTRICWYTDTPTGNWLIDYHPAYSNLFLATGGSGHGYKFLPVIGDRIADVMLGQDGDALGAELRQKWRWPVQKHKSDHVWTDDWRGGKKGMILDVELGRSSSLSSNGVR
ncbi:hypothetical protein B0A50_03809 [Salinomyces thailandicus]|uniref:FAD dependent oxidoreductase domain-containing protein n=1 Tax=Salinomyces thailandicus TaxID=706561 RepID=A0A4U0U1K6_9PEZI|nr:hypothetical protein B0A50_03809 [Salinomyces thailandica]